MSQASDTPETGAQHTISRRRALKGMGAAAMAVGGVTIGASPAAAASKTSIQFYQTQKIYNNHGWTPMDRTGEWIGLSLDIPNSSYSVAGKYDAYSTSTSDASKQIDNFNNWMKNNGYKSEADLHLLLTNDITHPNYGDIEGLANVVGGDHALAEGFNLNKLDQYSEYKTYIPQGTGDAETEHGAQFQTVMHELMHLWGWSHGDGYGWGAINDDKDDFYDTPCVGDGGVCAKSHDCYDGEADKGYYTTQYAKCTADQYLPDTNVLKVKFSNHEVCNCC